MENSPKFMDCWARVSVTGALTAARWVSAAALTGGAGAGTYDLTLQRGLNVNEMLPMVCIDTTAANAIARVSSTSDTVKRVTLIDDAGAAVDAGFYFAAWRVAWGAH